MLSVRVDGAERETELAIGNAVRQQPGKECMPFIVHGPLKQRQLSDRRLVDL